MHNPIKLGVIGAGMVSQLAHLPSFKAIENVELYALADHDEALANAVGMKFGFKQIYTDHIKLLEDNNVEAVAVIVHRYATPGIIQDVLAYQKHVFSEKPMAFSANIALKLANTAKSKNIIYAIGFMKRHECAVNRAKEIINNSIDMGLGKIISVRCKNYCKDYVGQCNDYISTSFRKPAAFVNTIFPEWLPENLLNHYDWFMNVASHSVNLIQYLLGNEIAISHVDLSNSYSAVALLKIKEISIVLDVGKAATGRWEESVEIFFERGRVEIQFTSLKQRDQSATLILDINRDQAVRSIETFNSPWAFALQARNFIETIEGKCTLRTESEEALKGIQIIEEIWKHYLTFQNILNKEVCI